MSSSGGERFKRHVVAEDASSSRFLCVLFKMARVSFSRGATQISFTVLKCLVEMQADSARHTHFERILLTLH